MSVVQDPRLRSALSALTTPRAWLVGGALRDELLGRATVDLDLAVDGDVAVTARRLGTAAGGHAFSLSEAFGGWRVVAHDHSWQVDLLPLAGHSIEEDLRRRDFTVNAIARELSSGVWVDPLGGREDLVAGRLRAASPRAFSQDPLRVLRLARLIAELGLRPDEATVAAARQSAAQLADVAPERVFAELTRVIGAPRALEGLSAMDEVGATAVVLPELADLGEVEQSAYHHLDVLGHTRAVLAEVIALEREPERLEPPSGRRLSALLAEPLADGLSRATALRLGALFHDIAKPQTQARSAEGRITFFGHDSAGAGVARAILTRLRASERLREHVSLLVRHHLRLGFLVHDAPLGRREIYRYLQSCQPVAVDVTVLSAADRLATLGRRAEEAIPPHLELARQLTAAGLDWRADPPRPPVPGDRLAVELGLEPGPQIGRLLRSLEEAAYAGEIQGPDQALALARVIEGRDGAG